MQRNLIETVMGAVVLLVAGVFVYFAYVTAEIRAAPGYSLTAKFYKIGGLTRGSDVQVSGIKVGTVSEVRLDEATFDAVVVMTIDPRVSLPTNTVASIDSIGLLGGKFVRLEPGDATDRLAAGGEIAETREYRSLEDQVGEIIFLATSPTKPSE